ncbi:MAG: toll/interleukin-1 receptor domain-containing protein [Candidatus Gastranaerophilales bacterium]|nr:toll/interleukin-1 receptor domain-containing protein [Candidatus Gastranaerophilales bacterium]
MSMDFETQLNELLERAKNIKSPINASFGEINIKEYNKPSEVWMNDVQIFYENYLKDHALGDRINSLLFHRRLDAYNNLVSCLESISKDRNFIDKMNGIQEVVAVPKYQAKGIPEYDVFISHANRDKEDFVEELFQAINKLGINIFYDKESLEWGDDWKAAILNGTKKAEFAVIVISENFFDREWTEKELAEFLSRQNRNGQKLILPILHNITMAQLQEQYPSVADIQAIDSKKYTCDQIAILFARQLIRRLKNI